jgi:hypothetical protein
MYVSCNGFSTKGLTKPNVRRHFYPFPNLTTYVSKSHLEASHTLGFINVLLCTYSSHVEEKSKIPSNL